MVNNNSPIIQQMMQSGVQFNEQVAGPTPTITPQQPLMTGYNQQPNMYYNPQPMPMYGPGYGPQLNMGYYGQPNMYGPGWGPQPDKNNDIVRAGQFKEGQLNNGQFNTGYNPNNMYYAQQNNVNYFQQQNQKNPWDLINFSSDQFNAMNPPTPSNGQKYNPFVNTPNYGYYRPGYQTEVPHTYTVKAYNPTGLSVMYSTDMNNRLAELERKYQRMNADAVYRRKFNGGYNAYNYYGSMNTIGDMSIIREYQRERAKIEEEAKQNVIDFNLRLSRLAHSYKGDIDVNNPEEFAKIEAIYRDRTVELDPVEIKVMENRNRFGHLVDISQQCINGIGNAWNKVTEEHNKIIPPDADLDTFLNKAGLLLWESSVEKMMKKGVTLAERMSYERFQYEMEKQSFTYDMDRYNKGVSTYDPRQAFYDLDNLNVPIDEGNPYDPGPQGPKVPSTASIDLNTGQLVMKSFDQWKAELEEYRKDPNYCAAEREYEKQREAFARSVDQSGLV